MSKNNKPHHPPPEYVNSMTSFKNDVNDLHNGKLDVKTLLERYSVRSWDVYLTRKNGLKIFSAPEGKIMVEKGLAKKLGLADAVYRMLQRKKEQARLAGVIKVVAAGKAGKKIPRKPKPRNFRR